MEEVEEVEVADTKEPMIDLHHSASWRGSLFAILPFCRLGLVGVGLTN